MRKLGILLLLALLISGGVLGQTPPTGDQPWDLLATSQRGQFTFYDAPTGSSVTGKPLEIGDFDGNGCGDLAVTGQNASHSIAGEWRGSGGHLRLIMNVCPIIGTLTAEALTGRGFTIYGAY
ncbi:MAG: hypothetical protein J0M07_27760, partial [Anaerolineae bacterium]|nr:hypothetical protein [Anaerolineae bacterium]